MTGAATIRGQLWCWEDGGDCQDHSRSAARTECWTQSWKIMIFRKISHTYVFWCCFSCFALLFLLACGLWFAGMFLAAAAAAAAAPRPRPRPRRRGRRRSSSSLLLSLLCVVVSLCSVFLFLVFFLFVFVFLIRHFIVYSKCFMMPELVFRSWAWSEQMSCRPLKLEVRRLSFPRQTPEDGHQGGSNGRSFRVHLVSIFTHERPAWLRLPVSLQLLRLTTWWPEKVGTSPAKFCSSPYHQHAFKIFQTFHFSLLRFLFYFGKPPKT